MGGLVVLEPAAVGLAVGLGDAVGGAVGGALGLQLEQVAAPKVVRLSVVGVVGGDTGRAVQVVQRVSWVTRAASVLARDAERRCGGAAPMAGTGRAARETGRLAGRRGTRSGSR